jgi:DNA-directed RNA polymerase subunit K/omega
MTELPEHFDSVFRYIVVVSQRAEQLINGAKTRTESQHAKRTLKAKNDVDAGVVPWRVLSQEELDAQRQAIVDQFRAEVAGEGFAPAQAAAIPDVLPTAAAGAASEAPDRDTGERDDELTRLRRLLGMADTGAVAPAAVEEDEKAEAKEAEEPDAGADSDGGEKGDAE